ncbi:hypothetical protein [Cryptosporangium phraense]|uniref:Uncharacterized protein n=1 Tax=Cryptosporangium phraense TaxID=2593070 RepID=A0A545AUT3_9ACTN|nr:hypothetical protein [Cryptosporangium phraense]TQS45097.1 hypothetical protein FL583_11405 [Cryptosporangium phraense]
MTSGLRAADLAFVPWADGDVERHVATGAAWLREQLGRPAVFVPQKSNYENNPALERALPGVPVVTGRTWHQADWRGGPLLVCWPTESMLGLLSQRLGGTVTAACVLEWGDAPYQRAWLAAHHATDLTAGMPLTSYDADLPSVVVVAMRHLASLVNHANGLAGHTDKGLAIETLTTLVRGGHRFDVDQLCAWALAQGFTTSETERLRDYGTKALAGHRFRDGREHFLHSESLDRWTAEANSMS